MSHPAKLINASHARAFILGGNATVTMVSVKTGTRFTYKIRAGAAEPPDVWFVSLLSGPDNEADYSYLGRIDASLRLWSGRKTPKPGDVASSAPSSKAFSWAWSHILGEVLPSEQLEIWHEGRCGRCGRKLTVPASIASGFGPECAEMI